MFITIVKSYIWGSARRCWHRSWIFFTSRGLIFRGSYNQGFCNQVFLQSVVLQSGVLQSGVLTIRSSYNQEFLQSGVYISVSYMTRLCLVIYIDRCSLHSGVQMNMSYMTGLWGSYNQLQGFLRSGVLTIRGSNECVLHDESVPRCWYWS